MAVVGTPIYAQALKVWACQVATGNSNRDGATGSYQTLLTAGGNGSRIDALKAVAAGTVTDGMLRIFVQPGGTGAFYLVGEIPVTATTPSATAEVWSTPIDVGNIRFLAAGTVVKCGTEKSEAINVIADGGDY